MDQETELSLLNIYIASHSVLRHDIQPEYSIKYSRISLTRVTKRTSLAAKGYEYGKNKDVEYTRIFCDGAGRGGLEKFMQLSKLKSWVST